MSISAVPTFELEESLARDGYDVIVGFDEVGRGSLAGPVMVGAAAFLAPRLAEAERTMPHYLADSKMLTEHRRDALYEPLQQWADAWAIGSATNAEIDDWGISHALGVAALRALDAVERTLFGPFATVAGESGGTAATRGDEARGGARSGMPSDMRDDARLGAQRDEVRCDARGDDARGGARGDEAQDGMRIGAQGGGMHVDAHDDLHAGTFVDGLLDINDPAPHMPRVGAILDGPNDYITKALGTFEAPEVPIPAHVVTQVKGDQHCGSVACAAVLAKVTRDRLMVRLAESNPDYARYVWAQNKGYGSKAHKAAIAEYGPSDLHRISWKLT